jgi:uncharacterized phage-associated protein
MKLQKLLYYAQGFAMVILGKPLFDEDFEAWDYGPVLRAVYDKFKGYGSGALPKPENFSFDVYTIAEVFPSKRSKKMRRFIYLAM